MFSKLVKLVNSLTNAKGMQSYSLDWKRFTITARSQRLSEENDLFQLRNDGVGKR